jgi:hypothetical protein
MSGRKLQTYHKWPVEKGKLSSLGTEKKVVAGLAAL